MLSVPHSLQLALALIASASAALACSPARGTVAHPQGDGLSVARGRLVDESDGLPVAGMDVLEVTRDGRMIARGTTAPNGRFTLCDETLRARKYAPGQSLLAFEDSGRWLRHGNQQVSFPLAQDVAVPVGPTYFLDLPEELSHQIAAAEPGGRDRASDASSRPIEWAVFGPGDDEDRPLSRWNGIEVDLRSDTASVPLSPPWIRLPAPLPEGPHHLRIRWGNPMVEARLRLPTRRGLLRDRLKPKIQRLGAVDFEIAREALPRSQPLFLFQGDNPETAAERYALLPAHPANNCRIAVEWLTPGDYRWELGFEGFLGRGTVTVTPGVRTTVKLSEPSAALAEAPPCVLPMDSSLCPGLDPETLFCAVLPEGLPSHAPPSEVQLKRRTDSSGLEVHIPHLGPGTWLIGIRSTSHVAMSVHHRLLRDGVLSGPLTLVPLAPRRKIRIRGMDRDGNEISGGLSAAYVERHRIFKSVGSHDPSSYPLSIEVPAIGKTSLILHSSAGLGEWTYDPASDGDEIAVQLTRPLATQYFRITDTEGRPLEGVSLEREGLPMGRSNAAGHFWFDQRPWDPGGRWSVGSANPGLRLVYPPENSFYPAEVEQNSRAYLGAPIIMERSQDRDQR
ncbi:MAG: hypothetical protein AAGG01_10840 [Planctomycetota bacterium]